MISIDRPHKRVQLNMFVLTIENYYGYWRQYVRPDGTLVNIGSFYWRERHCNGWNEFLRKRIIKMSLGGKE